VVVLFFGCKTEKKSLPFEPKSMKTETNGLIPIVNWIIQSFFYGIKQKKIQRYFSWEK